MTYSNKKYNKVLSAYDAMNTKAECDSTAIKNFIATLDGTGFTKDFDWPKWVEDTGEDNITSVAYAKSADEETLRKLMTVHSRKERLSPGHLNNLAKSGYLDALVSAVRSISDKDTEGEARPKLVFEEIPQLPDNWWDGTPSSNPSIVWTVWDENTYYLWGANVGNYQLKPIGTIIGGGGMAGPNGPTRGRHHPHYVGIITMDASEMPKNDAVFNYLAGLASNNDNNILIPVYNTSSSGTPEYKFSLGTGIGGSQPKWADIQIYILKQIVKLAALCDVDIPDGVYWPDCRQPQPYPRYQLKSIQDIEDIIDKVLS